MAETASQPFASLKLRPVELPNRSPFRPRGLAIGSGDYALEVLVVESGSTPRMPQLRELWKTRRAGRAAPMLVVVLHDGRATLCGPAGEQPPIYENIDPGQAERLCKAALDQPDRHAALRFLRDALPTIDSPLPGVRNEGFLATHVLQTAIRTHDRWSDATRRAASLLTKRGEDLLRGLGFEIERHDSVTSILKAAGRKVAVGVLLTPGESAELTSTRFSDLSPISYALSVADRENLPYVLVLQGSTLRLYPTRDQVGVGRRGRTETWLQINCDLLPDGDAGYLWLLLSAEALADGGTLEQLIGTSDRFAGDLATRFRDRIYERVIPRLATGLAEARGLKQPTAADLEDTYAMALTVLFRLLFIAYAEDKDLLPYEWNELYRARSLKRKAIELRDFLRSHGCESAPEDAPWDANSDSLWQEVDALFKAIDKGKGEWGVPAYDGGLFIRDAKISRIGGMLAGLSLPNPVMGPVLCDLLLIGTPEGLGPVDFRSLGVREFGTIYEGLLESELSCAEHDLVVDARTGHYRPLTDRERKKGVEPDVRLGRIYLHDRSGARKSSGTYFTKPFAVNHLLDAALEPALRDHLARLDALSDDDAAEAFFDFRVADIAMGSGHFLVAAIDRIERAFSNYLARRPLSGVRAELSTLRTAALNELKRHGLADTLGDAIEDMQLLRRLIARRCIYGVDLNPIAVDLARLSIWIHTFVPGLPLSLLDHNLVCGNSLTGIGTLDEVLEAMRDYFERHRGSGSLFLHAFKPDSLLGDALKPLKKLAKIADATPSELARAREALDKAREATRPAEALCDILAACRLTGSDLPIHPERWDKIKSTLYGSKEHRAAQKELAHLRPLHFPVAFPEVFCRGTAFQAVTDHGHDAHATSRGTAFQAVESSHGQDARAIGFDVIVGNPPWEEATLEEDAFWARHAPGLRGQPQRDQERLKRKLRRRRPDLVELYEKELAAANALRAALVAGPYPGMGTGDPDLYKAFCWRFWQLACEHGGRIGVVLPRSAWAAKGSQAFREHVFEHAPLTDLTMLVNNRQWIFPDVHPQYTIALTAIERRSRDTALRGTAFQAVKTHGQDGQATRLVRLRGPFRSLERYLAGRAFAPAEFEADQVRSWTDSASLPLLPAEESVEVFAQLRKHPRLDLDDPDQWRVRPHRELDATNDKKLMDVRSASCPPGFWPVFKGESFDLWTPDTGTYYAWADPKKVIAHLHAKRARGRRRGNSVWHEFADRPDRWWESEKTLPCFAPRIAFRDITNRTNQRTVVVALVPPGVFITNKGPFFLWPRGDEADQAYLLGVLSSLPLDWYARRFVEVNLNFHILNPFPIPRPERGDPRRRRVVEIAARLACVDRRFTRWGRAVERLLVARPSRPCKATGGAPAASTDRMPVPPVEPIRPCDLRKKDPACWFDLLCELDAVVACLYGLSEAHLRHIFETFHEGWGPGRPASHPTLGDYDERLKRTVEWYRRHA